MLYGLTSFIFFFVIVTLIIALFEAFRKSKDVSAFLIITASVFALIASLIRLFL